MDDRSIEVITTSMVKEFFCWLCHDFQITRRGNQPIEPRQLSSKTVRNCWAALSSFFHWVTVKHALEENPFKIPCPKVITKPIPSLSKEDVSRLLAFTNVRDKALILILLDTGARVSEFCNVNVEDVDLETGHSLLRKCKNDKVSVYFLRKSARNALVRYLFGMEDFYPSGPLFLDCFKTSRLTRNDVGLALPKLGESGC
jgi:site-specific recombinase XerD